MQPGNHLANRRAFLADAGMGLANLAFASMLSRDGAAHGSDVAAPSTNPSPRARSVIWLFMIGGVSHLESFDPKPAVNRYAGMTIEETPHRETLVSPFLANRRIVARDDNGQIRYRLLPLQTGFRKHGQSGIEVSDWFPRIAGHIDDIAVVRSMWTEDANHSAQLQFHTGRHRLDGFSPAIGSWVHYGLGSLNENLPQFVVLGEPLANCCGGLEAHRADYLGPQHDGIPLSVDPRNPIPYAAPERNVFLEEQRGQFELLHRLHRLTERKHPHDERTLARRRAYELAFRMQTAVPDIFRLSDETRATLELYGNSDFGRICLSARRLVERGVRFVQVYHGANGGAGTWDGHGDLRNTHSANAREVDQPIAALLQDLKQRGLLDETIVAFVTEFGRTPGSQTMDGQTVLPIPGRDHHPYGFSVWLAGGGIKGGTVHGATDEIGFHAVENRHYVTDLHATILHQLGLNPRNLARPGRQRLERDLGVPIAGII